MVPGGSPGLTYISEPFLFSNTHTGNSRVSQCAASQKEEANMPQIYRMVLLRCLQPFSFCDCPPYPHPYELYRICNVRVLPDDASETFARGIWVSGYSQTRQRDFGMDERRGC